MSIIYLIEKVFWQWFRMSNGFQCDMLVIFIYFETDLLILLTPFFGSSNFGFSTKNGSITTFSYSFNFWKGFPRIPFQYQMTSPRMNLSVLDKVINFFIARGPFGKIVSEMSGVAGFTPFTGYFYLFSFCCEVAITLIMTISGNMRHLYVRLTLHNQSRF